MPGQTRRQPAPERLPRELIQVVQHQHPVLVLVQPAQHRLDLALLLRLFALGQRRRDPPGQAGQIADQGCGLVGTDPEAAVGVVGAMQVQVAESELGLAYAAQAVQDHLPVLLQLLAEFHQIRLTAGEVLDRVRRDAHPRLRWQRPGRLLPGHVDSDAAALHPDVLEDDPLVDVARGRRLGGTGRPQRFGSGPPAAPTSVMLMPPPVISASTTWTGPTIRCRLRNWAFTRFRSTPARAAAWGASRSIASTSAPTSCSSSPSRAAPVVASSSVSEPCVSCESGRASRACTWSSTWGNLVARAA